MLTDRNDKSDSNGADRWAVLAKAVRDHQKNQHSGHIPVMLEEVLTHLDPRDGGVYVDGTFGAGGYARAILAAANCTVYAIDRDPQALARAEKISAEYQGRLQALPGCFGEMADLLRGAGVEKVDGIVLDIGVSSMQIDDAARGFSFREDGPLDMRMGGSGPSAADLVNSLSEEDLADIIFAYGEERASRRIAKRIVEAREIAPLKTTRELTALVHAVLPMHGGIKTDTATRTFQALRIAVNDDLGELDRALDAALTLLTAGGRLVVVSFHSLEDGRVKKFFRHHAGQTSAPSRHAPQQHKTAAAPLLSLPVSKAVAAGEREASENTRARSAKLRVAERTAASLPKGPSHA